MMKEALRYLSIILGAISVVSFTQRFIDIGLFETVEVLVEYYRNIAHIVFAVPFDTLGIKIPASLIDVWTLSFVGASAYVAVPNIEDSRFFRVRPNLANYKYWKVAFLFVMGMSGLGIAVLISSLYPNTYVDEFHEEPLDLMKEAAKKVFYILGAAVIFFVLNAFAPSA